MPETSETVITKEAVEKQVGDVTQDLIKRLIMLFEIDQKSGVDALCAVSARIIELGWNKTSNAAKAAFIANIFMLLKESADFYNKHEKEQQQSEEVKNEE